MSGHGHACPVCGGVGTIRIRGKAGSIRVMCERCDGTGTLRPAR